MQTAKYGKHALDGIEEETRNARPRHQQGTELVSSNAMSSEQLAHEILLDPSFVMDQQDDRNKLVRTRLRVAFTPAFWDSLLQDLFRVPVQYERVYLVLQEIKDVIQRCFGDRADIQHSAANAFLHLDEIRQGIIDMDFQSYLSSIVKNVLVKAHESLPVQYSHHVQSTLEGWSSVLCDTHNTFLYKALQFLMERTYAIRMDVANMKFSRIVPILLSNGIEYERTGFRQKLDAGIITLQRTEAWIKHAVKCHPPTQEEPASFQNCYVKGLVDLVAEYPHWGGTKRSFAEVPETLELDHLRIRALNAHFHTDVMCTIMILTLHQKIQSHNLLKKLADVIIGLAPFPTSPDHCIEMVIQTIGNTIPQREADVIGFLLEEHLQRSHHIYAYYVDLYKKHWVDLVNIGFAKPNYDALPSSSKRVKLPDFAKNLMDNTEKRAVEFCAMAMLNKKVHGQIYDKMMVLKLHIEKNEH